MLKIWRTLWLISYKIFENYDTGIFLNISNTIVKITENFYFAYLKYTIKNPVAIIEATSSHGETIPSVYKYFNELGLKADIIALSNHIEIRSLDCLKPFKPKIRYVKHDTLSKIFSKGVLDKYKIVFYNSFNTYIINSNYYPNVFKAFKINNKKSFVCGFLHHLDYNNECEENNFKYFALTDLKTEYANENNFINPHYFGEISITPKNDITNFIVVGNIDVKRRNIHILFDNIERLLNEGYRNFKITCVGRIINLSIPSSITPYVEFKGRLPYPKMYKYMEDADFFLPLLDPNNPEHDRYITIGTSGSFQLIYGFQKPCLIHEKFARHHFLNNENSIIYNKNEELYSAMKFAIDMSSSEYDNMQKNISRLSNSLYKKSLENLKKTLEENVHA